MQSPPLQLAPSARLSADRALVERNLRRHPLPRYAPGVLHGVERLPQGGALLVGNHGPLAIDTAVLVHAVHRDTGRIIRPLGDRLLFKSRYGRRMARSWGGVEGNPENAHSLLSAGEWVVVYPGGARETLRGPDQRYQLLWEGRIGFARTALAAAVPIVPVACIGIDETMRQWVTQEQALRTWPGKAVAALVGPNYVPPLFVPRLRASRFHYWFGTPILGAVTPDATAKDREAAAQRLQQQVKLALEELMNHGLAARRASRSGRERGLVASF